MFPSDINFTEMANERTAVENAGRAALRGLGPELGQRYAEYHQQTGNLYATGYALAADEVRAMLQPIAQAIWLSLWRSLWRSPWRALQRVFGRRAAARIRHGQA